MLVAIVNSDFLWLLQEYDRRIDVARYEVDESVLFIVSLESGDGCQQGLVRTFGLYEDVVNLALDIFSDRLSAANFNLLHFVFPPIVNIVSASAFSLTKRLRNPPITPALPLQNPFALLHTPP